MFLKLGKIPQAEESKEAKGGTAKWKEQDVQRGFREEKEKVKDQGRHIDETRGDSFPLS